MYPSGLHSSGEGRLEKDDWGYFYRDLGRTVTDGREVVHFKSIKAGKVYLIVPGYFVRNEKPSERGMRKMTVEIIPENERDSIRKQLQEISRGREIIFWK